jgi:hypothetical protein
MDEAFNNVLGKHEWEVYICTLYKRKDRKVNPVNTPLPNGVNPGGGPIFGPPHGPPENHRSGKIVPKGSRLTPERLAQMKIGGQMLSESEKKLFIDILFKYEGAIAFDDSEMGFLNPEIEPPVKIHTVPHVPWQQQNLRLPRAMQQEATKQIRKKLENGMLEFSQGPYRSRYFLVDKRTAITDSSTMSNRSTRSLFVTRGCHPL